MTHLLRTSCIIAALTLSACTNTGNIVVENRTGATVPRVTLTITSSGDRTQSTGIDQIAPGEQRHVTYDIDSEYRLDIEITEPDGTVDRIPYGYVIDSWRNPTHRIELESDRSVLVDGETQPSQ